ncbi:MAG: sugar phosphate nucleotidyltransferase [Spirochaetia bacterium]|nr:sugar phosphate nucleotidyltransferase [Spirochaetia bacterium]
MSIKCLIPAAGTGTRMRPFTHSLPKAMLPVAGKPAVYHIIDVVKEAGVSDFVIITGYLCHLMESEILKAYPQLNIEFVRQKEQKGLGHACYMAKEKFSENDGLLIIYGDTLFKADLNKMLNSEKPVIGVYEVEDARRFGVVILDENKENITDFIEKPEIPPTNLVIPGVNYFPKAGSLFNALKHIIENNIKSKNEFQITDAFAHMIKNENIQMTYQKIDAWFDTGTLDEMLASNKKILQTNGNFNSAQTDNAKINEPVYIAKNVRILNSEIGPFASIAEGSVIEDSVINSSIIDINSEIKNSKIEESILGRNVHLKNFQGKILLGDNGRIVCDE